MAFRRNKNQASSQKVVLLILCLLAAAAGLVRSTGNSPAAGGTHDLGEDRLVSWERLPGVEGGMCEWMPASARVGMQQQDGTGAAPQPGGGDLSQRQPVRMIRDAYAAYSAVAVDPINNEVVLTDENLFQILVYDRMDNTPPTARMTEPKRMIAGLRTKIEFQCGLYIDPRNGDIFAVNNDTVDTLVIFSREARGDVPPTRELHTPHGTFGIAVDEQAQEMFLTTQHDSSVVVFRKYAEKDEPPVRLLQGPRTMLADPHGIAIDTRNQLMFVSNHGAVSGRSAALAPGVQGREQPPPNWPLDRDVAVPGSGEFRPHSITVYSLKASGDTPPLRTIQGPLTQMNWPAHIFMDEERGELYVANDMRNSILVFDSSASGNVAPRRVLQGPRTMLKNPTGVFVDLKNDELWVANFGNHAATVYPRNASGDTPPLRVIRSGPLDEPALGIGNPHPIAYDTKREEILVPN